MHGKGREVLDNMQTLLRNAGWVGPTLAELGPSVRATGNSASRVFTGMMNTVAWDNPDNIKSFQQFLARVQSFLDAQGARPQSDCASVVATIPGHRRRTDEFRQRADSVKCSVRHTKRGGVRVVSPFPITRSGPVSDNPKE